MQINIVLKKTNEEIELFSFLEEDNQNEGFKNWIFKNKTIPEISIKIIEKPIGQIFQAEISNEINTNIEFIYEQINAQIVERIENEQNGIDNTENEIQETTPYSTKQIKIRNENWQLKYIYELINDYKDVILLPDFQRNLVWDTIRKSRLIESLMLGIPIPAFYLAEDENGKYQVVDGLQRLSAITDFINNKYALKHLEYLANECSGLYFKEEKSKGKKGIAFEYIKRIYQTQINVNIIEASSPLKVKYDVFRRINTGGKHLNNQEIRNCLADAAPRELINELATSQQFKTATTNSVSTTRMDAQELVLRFIGFYYLEFIKDLRLYKDETLEYKGNMTSFLDACIGKLNIDNGKHHQKIKDAFYRAMDNASYLFGDFAFRKVQKYELMAGSRRPLINKSLFTTWSLELSKYEPDTVKKHNEKNSFSIFLSDYLENFANKTYWAAVSYSTNDKQQLEIAFKGTREIIKHHLKQI